MSRPRAVGSAAGQLYVPKSSKCRPDTSPLLLRVVESEHRFGLRISPPVPPLDHVSYRSSDWATGLS